MDQSGFTMDPEAQAELELLEAMFSGDGELEVSVGWPVRVTLRLAADSAGAGAAGDAGLAVELTAELPRDYPKTEPLLMARIQGLSSESQRQLNRNLTQYVGETSQNSICILNAINWLQENSPDYIVPEKPSGQIVVPKSTTYSRLWVYSHHIYSTTKRKDILSLADQNNITGFMLSGKPGIICVEGESADCEEWWSSVKSMNWKRIGVKKKEEFNDEFIRKFNKFEEVTFRAETNRSADVHTDMGEFNKYLINHDCTNIFTDIFGINAKE